MNPLYKFLHKEVQTPQGRGILLQVFDTRVSVDLGKTKKFGKVEKRVVTMFKPEEICGK